MERYNMNWFLCLLSPQNLQFSIIDDIYSTLLSTRQNAVISNTYWIYVVFVNVSDFVCDIFHPIVPYPNFFVLPSTYPDFVVLKCKILHFLVTWQCQQRLYWVRIHDGSKLSFGWAWIFNIEELNFITRCSDETGKGRGKSKRIIGFFVFGCVERELWIIRIAVVHFIAVICPQEDLITIVFGGKYFAIDGRGSDDCNFARVGNNLLYLHVRVFFCGIGVEEGFQVIDEVVVFVGEFNGRNDNEVGNVLPRVFWVVIDSVGSAWEVQSLMSGLWIGLQDGSPL